jgi:phosphohistidine phosphatase
MNLLVIRHARAENAEEFAKTGASDELRPLTGDGRERMRQAAAGLHRLVDALDVLASSPLVRARETADIVAAEFEGPAITELDELRPEAPPEEFVEWLQTAGSEETIAIVGHQPQLSGLVGWLLAGRRDEVAQIKKGSALMLELNTRGRRRIGERSGVLLWSLTPKQLRMLGE